MGSTRFEETPGVDTKHLGDVFQALQGEVAFAAFDATHVGAVVAEDVSERLLAHAALQTVGM